MSSQLSNCEKIGNPCFVAKVKQQATNHAQFTAIESETRNFTYKEYFETASALSISLNSSHVGYGDKVVVFLEQAEFIPIALLSVLIVGAVYVPIDTAWPASRIQAILEDVLPKVIITQRSLGSACESVDKITIHYIDEPTHVNHNEVNIALPKLDDVAVIFYTSGSTGLPKGVELSYGNIQCFLDSALETYRFVPTDTHLAIAKYSFSISIFDQLLPFYCGGSLIVQPRSVIMNPVKLATFVNKSKCFHMGPALLETLVKHAIDNDSIFPDIRHLSSGGDMIPAPLLEKCKSIFPNSEIWVIYGCTEIACMGTTWKVERTKTTEVTYVGKSFDRSEVILLDDNYAVMEKGEIGEVYFAGQGVAKGYLNRNDLNQTKFKLIDGKRYYASGDFGILDESGNLQLKGRKDFQIKINGIRIETEEIEYWLNTSEGLEKSIVVGARDRRKELKIVAFVKKEANMPLVSERSLKEHLALSLPDYMLPSKIYFVAEFPLNTNGKLDRNQLIKMAELNLTKNHSSVSSDNKTAKKLVEIWHNAGASGTIYDDSNFFDLGGDSLGAVQLVCAFESEFNLICDFEFVYSNPEFSAQLATINKGVVNNNLPPVSLVVPLGKKSVQQTKTLYMTPGMDGHIVSFHNFGELFPEDWCVYGLLYPNFEGEQYETIQDVAQRLLTEILKVQEQGCYYLCGHSSGGIVNLEIARLLKNMGKEVTLVFVEARIYEKAQRRPLKDLFMVYLKNKPRIMLDKILNKNTKRYLASSLHEDTRAKQKESLTLEKLSGAFTLNKKQLRRYKTTYCDVQAILIKNKERIWWDELRQWPFDYGLGEFVNLISISESAGDHVSIVMNKANHPELAATIVKHLSMIESEKVSDLPSKIVSL